MQKKRSGGRRGGRREPKKASHCLPVESNMTPSNANRIVFFIAVLAAGSGPRSLQPAVAFAPSPPRSAPTQKYTQIHQRQCVANIPRFMASDEKDGSVSSSSSSVPARQPMPTTFREAEVIGLRFMQEGKHEDALNAFQKAMKLPGSRPDVVRTKTLSGPSPVGGSQGGTEGKLVMSLDEFEMQAAHYNIACAYARLGNVPESIANLKLAFDCGFDNYATVRADPDLSDLHSMAEFENLMGKYDKRFHNPLNMFGRKPGN